ncbi:MAG: phosphatase [Actinobacteria bacterium HGW-Actinobacteria-10]|jgi:putative hydrolase|nr:MAG: phosphatase [Actinobacteria bacterium HGW-Actinobacteria-10]
MKLLADLHTHTTASGHGYSSALELATAAAAKGLELIAITDHGPSVPQGAHPWYFWNLKVVPSSIDGVQILKGCEANVSPESENGIDLPDELLALMDFVAVGFHPLTGFDEHDCDRNTESLLRVIANPFVDQITHPGNDHEFPLDLDAIVRAAARHRVILELNDHSFAPTSARAGAAARERDFAAAAVLAGAPVAIGSDAHFAFHVGRFDSAISAAEEIGLTRDEIINRDAATVLDFLTSKRDRPRLGIGGAWLSDGGGIRV